MGANADLLTFTAVDVETTGLSPDKHRMIEIGAVKYQNGREIGRYSSFIRIGTHVPPSITALTGIHDAMLEDAPEERDALGGFLAFAESDILLGHNLKFDYAFLKTAAARCGMEFERDGIDTLVLSRKFHPEQESRSLGAMCLRYGIDTGRAHRAFDDARAAAGLYFRLYEQFAAGTEGVFRAVPLICRVKKSEPMTAKQKKYLLDLAKYHKIEVKQPPNMTKSEASRLIDSIILQYGKMGRVQC